MFICINVVYCNLKSQGEQLLKEKKRYEQQEQLLVVDSLFSHLILSSSSSMNCPAVPESPTRSKAKVGYSRLVCSHWYKIETLCNSISRLFGQVRPIFKQFFLSREYSHELGCHPLAQGSNCVEFHKAFYSHGDTTLLLSCILVYITFIVCQEYTKDLVASPWTVLITQLGSPNTHAKVVLCY